MNKHKFFLLTVALGGISFPSIADEQPKTATPAASVAIATSKRQDQADNVNKASDEPVDGVSGELPKDNDGKEEATDILAQKEEAPLKPYLAADDPYIQANPNSLNPIPYSQRADTN